MPKRKSYNYFNARTMLAVSGLLLLGFLVMSAIDSRKGTRISGMAVEIVPLEGQAFMIQPEEIKSMVYEGYRRDIEDLTVAAIDLNKVETVLETESFIDDADVFIDADNKLDIKIFQAKPASRIIDKHNKSYYLTEAGSPVPISKHASARVTVFSGKIDDFNIHRDTLTETQLGVLKLMDIMSKNDFANRMIEQVHVTERGYFLVQPKMGNFKFQLGKPIALEEKIENMELAYKEVLPAKGWDKYKKIDLSIDGQIICKK